MDGQNNHGSMIKEFSHQMNHSASGFLLKGDNNTFSLNDKRGSIKFLSCICLLVWGSSSSFLPIFQLGEETIGLAPQMPWSMIVFFREGYHVV